MSATLSAGIDSLTLKVTQPKEADGVTPRDDLIGIKVWYSTTSDFTPSTQGTLAYDGTGLDVTITGLTSGTLYYVKYALISEIEPDFYTISNQLSATPVYETQTVDTTAPPTPTGVSVTAGVGTIFISHDNPTYTAGRGHRKTHVFGLKTTAANDIAGYTFARAAANGPIGQFTGNVWSFSSDPDTEWHIWLKWETNNGVLSNVASGGNTGNTAKTSQDVSTLLSALTGKITTGQLNTALNTNLTNLNNQYVIKVGAAGQVAGFGIASTATDSGQATSEFGIQADKFWIAPPAVAQASAPTANLYRGYIWIDTSVTPNVTKYWTGSAWSTTRQTVLPFAVVTTPETIGGQTVNAGVYIDAAYIKDGTITNAKIGDATITAAKIGSVDATKITVNQLTASQINSNGLSIRDSAGNLLLDASNSQLGVSLYVGTGSNKRLLSTVGAYASTPNTAYIGEFASAPTFNADRAITSWSRVNGITTVATSGGAHGFVLGTKVTIAGAAASVNGTYEIIEIPSTTTFKIVNAGVDASAGTAGTASGYLYAENSVYKNTTDNNSYILTGTTLAWSLFIQKGYTPVKGTDYVDGLNPPVFLVTGDGIFTKLKNLTTTPSSLTLTTGYQNLTGTISYKWYKNDVVISAATASSYSVPSTDFVSAQGVTTATSNTYKCEITGTYNGASTTLTALKTVNLLTEGDDQITVVVTNPNPVFAAPASGYSGIDFSNGACDVKFYYGSTQLVNYAIGTYRFVLTQTPTRSNVSGNSVSSTGASNYSSTISAPTAMTADTGYIDLLYSLTYAGKTAQYPVRINYTLARAGAKGADSTVAGPRGSTWAYISGRTSWSDTVANAYFTNNFAGVKVINDTVTQYGTNFSETKVWDGSSWIKVSVAIDGNLLVKGTVAADSIASGTISVGVKIQSTDGNMVMDFINKTISITV